MLAVPAFATSSPNDQAGAPSSVGILAIPSQTPIAVTRDNPSVTVAINVEAVQVDIGVNDQYEIGDEFTVTLDGSPIFQTANVPQPTSTTVCTEVPPGNLASCAAEQTAGEIVQTGYGGCDLATAFGSGLSWGDSTPMKSGFHTLVITDVAPSFTSGVLDSPASFCLILENPPSFSAPEFPLGTGLVMAIAVVGLVLVKRAGLKVTRQAF